MPSGTEMKVLKGIKKRGGETNLFGVAREIGLSSDYARIVCRALGMADYLDMFRTGKIRLTNKGWKAVGGREVETPEGEEATEEGSGEAKKKGPETPHEKYNRWMSP
ncbi:MAG: hypothetical protein ABIN18_29000 [Pseudomonadota bacterium]